MHNEDFLFDYSTSNIFNSYFLGTHAMCRMMICLTRMHRAFWCFCVEGCVIERCFASSECIEHLDIYVIDNHTAWKGMICSLDVLIFMSWWTHYVWVDIFLSKESGSIFFYFLSYKVGLSFLFYFIQQKWVKHPLE